MKNKEIVLVTGATSGIGKATALKFAKEGYGVLVHGHDSQKDFAVVNEIEKMGGKAAPIFANFEREQGILLMFEEIEEKYGKLNILVNNAGTVNRKNYEDLKADDFQRLFMINVTAPYICGLEAKKLGCTSIVNIGSMRGFPQEATTPDYSASKAAIHNLTVSMARAFAPECRVNCVAPGFTKTALHEGSEERLKMEADKTPLKRVAQPEEIAESIFFLASEKSKFTTGAILLVDGGRNFV